MKLIKTIFASLRHPKNIFLLLTALITAFNFFSLIEIYLDTLNKPLSRPPEPGYEFADLKNKLKGVKRVGFLTNKDMSSERNDGQFLAAQYMLAPTILDCDSQEYRLFVIDATALIPAFDIMQSIGAEPIYVNRYSKILAERLR